MIIETQTFKEYHQNGELMYETTFSKIAPLFSALYRNAIIDKEGNAKIRTGSTKRYWNNGQLNWQLNYDNNGELIKENLPQFRKDGTTITY